MGADKPASTTEFTHAVISNLGKVSKLSPPKKYTKVELPPAQLGVNVVPANSRRLTGIDIYIESDLEPKALASELEKLTTTSPVSLQMISNRGAMVFPASDRRVSLVDHYRCRFVLRDTAGKLGDAEILSLLGSVGNKYKWMHVEKLQEFDGEQAYSKSQV
jgi:isocitrate dehydrogenase